MCELNKHSLSNNIKSEVHWHIIRFETIVNTCGIVAGVFKVFSVTRVLPFHFIIY